MGGVINDINWGMGKPTYGLLLLSHLGGVSGRLGLMV